MNLLTTRIDSMILAARCKLYDFISKEDGEVNVVAIVLLIGVAVALVLIFKEQISTLITTLMETITAKAKEVVNN